MGAKSLLFGVGLSVATAAAASTLLLGAVGVVPGVTPWTPAYNLAQRAGFGTALPVPTATPIPTEPPTPTSAPVRQPPPPRPTATPIAPRPTPSTTPGQSIPRQAQTAPQPQRTPAATIPRVSF